MLDDDLNSKKERRDKTKAQKMPDRPKCQAINDMKRFHRDQIYKAMGSEVSKGPLQQTSIRQDQLKFKTTTTKTQKLHLP